MNAESVIARGRWLTGSLTVAVCVGIATLIGFGYRATHEWQRSSALLIERHNAIRYSAQNRSIRISAGRHAIARLRKKVEPDPHHPRFIRTVHGDGYCLGATEAS